MSIVILEEIKGVFINQSNLIDRYSFQKPYLMVKTTSRNIELNIIEFCYKRLQNNKGEIFII